MNRSFVAALYERRFPYDRPKVGGHRPPLQPIFLLTFVLLCLGPVSAQAQTDAARGEALYRGRCANCHGVDGRGFRAPDLVSGRLPSSAADAELFQVIRRGIPGTEMPGSNMQDVEIRNVIAFVKTLSGPDASPERGDPVRGEAIFNGKGACTSCHRVQGRGGRLGPDLSRIGSSRSRAALIREIRQPAEYIPAGYEAVTLVTQDGQRVRGARKNEDTFSIQVMDTDERLRAFLKSDLRSLTIDRESLMPDYPPSRLSDGEVDDLVAYMMKLKRN